ncbi:MAG TPA: CbtA family protein [Stellaceae bacterium]|nr:CbtA family protein [Stellaceae bacterium]
MVGTLLLRGMVVGVIAGLLCFAFLKIVGEPQVDRAIAFETQMDEAKSKAKAEAAKAMGMSVPAEEEEPELVSRPVQAGIGLFTGVIVYSAAFGGLFALAFAFAHGRTGPLGARATSALLATAGIVSVYLAPSLKYPANPPSVGDPDTIGMRTALYFIMIAISVAAMIGAAIVRNRLRRRIGAWDASLIAGAAYLMVIVTAWLVLPGVNEVPEQFPAVVLWKFRIASIGAQVIMWATIGLLFGALTERATGTSGQLRFKARTL